MKPRYWAGTTPVRCDLGGSKLTTTFIDGRLKHGSWGRFCPACYHRFGVGLGVGLGQKFEKQPNGRWLKVEG